jgi:hypothetical protein
VLGDRTWWLPGWLSFLPERADPDPAAPERSPVGAGAHPR